MIIIVNGQIGSGKTYGAVANALLSARQDRKVALNWDVEADAIEKAKITRFNGLKELDELGVTGTDVYCDEAHKELGSRDWENLTPKLRNSFSESRKDDNHLIFISQEYKFLDVYVRRLAEEVWSVTRFLAWTIWWKAEKANPETGELTGWTDFRIFKRPWKDLERGHPFRQVLELWKFSKTIAGRYKSHEKTNLKKKSPEPQETPAGPPPAARQKTLV